MPACSDVAEPWRHLGLTTVTTSSGMTVRTGRSRSSPTTSSTGPMPTGAGGVEGTAEQAASVDLGVELVAGAEEAAADTGGEYDGDRG